MSEPRNPPAYAELIQWMEEAVCYVNASARSPSLKAEGEKLLRLAKPDAYAEGVAARGSLGVSHNPYVGNGYIEQPQADDWNRGLTDTGPKTA